MFLPSYAEKVGQRLTKTRSFCETVFSPSGGWDTRENIADMPEDRAVILDNWFPNSSKLTTRRGFTSFSTGMSGDVSSLMSYQPDSGTSRLFSAAQGKIYNVESGGAVGAALGSGFASDKWQHVNMATAGGRFLMMCNGSDAAQVWDGAALAATTLTGPDTTKLIWNNVHQNRLWVGAVNSLSAWYGGVKSITGAFSEFPLYGVASKGGYIMGMATWTRDSGDGQDDVAIFVTSEGEAIVYNGTDPSSSATWSLVGVFQIGKPIGRRFFIKAGGDLVLITQDGFVSAASMLVTDRSQAEKVAISAQINRAVNDALRNSGSNFGWQPVIYPKGTMLLINVPLDNLTSHQYVFNTLTRAPSRFTGMNADCWAVFNDGLYFGGKDGKVYLADNGNNDNGTSISCDCLPAFSYFRRPNMVKSFKMGEAVFQSDNVVNPAFDLNTDFTVLSSTAISSSVGGIGGTWDNTTWDTGVWGGDQDIYRAWKSINGFGRAASLRTRIQNMGPQISLLAINYIFEPGGYLR